MRILNFYETDPIAELAHPEQSEATSLQSSALSVFTDFSRADPLVVDPGMKITEAERTMIRDHVRLKFVVDKNHHFIGIISLEDLNGQAIIARVSQGFSRSELIVKDFMRPRQELKAFAYEELEQASIGDVVKALQDTGVQHCLVIDQTAHRIRGIISASDVARALRLPLAISHKSSFAEIFSVLYPKIHPESQFAVHPG